MFAGNMKVHLVYRRISGRDIERDDEVIADLKDVIVARSKLEGMSRELRIDDVVLKNGYPMLYFAFPGKKYDILKIYDLQGRYLGIYVDVLAYTKREGTKIEMLDLFIDIFIFPDGRFKVLDEEELDAAFKKGLINEKLYRDARSTMRKIIEGIEEHAFPPDIVHRYSLNHA